MHINKNRYWSLIPVEHLAERHRAAGAGAAALCGAARCFPAVSGDAAPRGWCPGRGAPPWSNSLTPSVNLHCLGSKGAAIYPTVLCHLGSPEKMKKLSFLNSKSDFTAKGAWFAFQSAFEDEIKSSYKWCTVQRKQKWEVSFSAQQC